MRKIAWLPILAFGLSGCSEAAPIGINCTSIQAYAIIVAVVDSVTNARLETRHIDATAIDANYTDIGTPGPPGFLYFADERPGTYTIELNAPGYAPWTQADVRVSRDVCHVQTVSLTARMQPAISS